MPTGELLEQLLRYYPKWLGQQGCHSVLIFRPASNVTAAEKVTVIAEDCGIATS